MDVVDVKVEGDEPRNQSDRPYWPSIGSSSPALAKEVRVGAASPGGEAIPLC